MFRGRIRLLSFFILIISVGLFCCEVRAAEEPGSKARDALRFDYIGYRQAPAVAVEPDGIKQVPFEIKGNRIELTLGDLHVCRLVVLPNDANAEQTYKEAYERILEDEQREF
jgi:hypothetical protein